MVPISLLSPRVYLIQTERGPACTSPRRDGICYLRKRVPMDLVAVYGKREILRSLSVKDRATALRLALRAVVALDDEFAEKRDLTPPSC
ncbi:DUF6538 domain-containing protein [Cupriavidus basilensis]|uniref:DUF6538 domain-containing protein n=1 Tax=Cupriavidus basilensis TaxID=68895 RepID=UPI003D355266